MVVSWFGHTQTVASISKHVTTIAGGIIGLETNLATFMKKVIYYEMFFQKVQHTLPNAVYMTANRLFARCYEYRDEIREELESSIAYVADAGRWIIGMEDWNTKMEKRLSQLNELVVLTNTLLMECALFGRLGTELACVELDAYLGTFTDTIVLQNEKQTEKQTNNRAPDRKQKTSTRNSDQMHETNETDQVLEQRIESSEEKRLGESNVNEKLVNTNRNKHELEMISKIEPLMGENKSFIENEEDNEQWNPFSSKYKSETHSTLPLEEDPNSTRNPDNERTSSDKVQIPNETSTLSTNITALETNETPPCSGLITEKKQTVDLTCSYDSEQEDAFNPFSDSKTTDPR